jgi:hypothetical protein
LLNSGYFSFIRVFSRNFFVNKTIPAKAFLSNSKRLFFRNRILFTKKLFGSLNKRKHLRRLLKEKRKERRKLLSKKKITIFCLLTNRYFAFLRARGQGLGVIPFFLFKKFFYFNILKKMKSNNSLFFKVTGTKLASKAGFNYNKKLGIASKKKTLYNKKQAPVQKKKTLPFIVRVRFRMGNTFKKYRAFPLIRFKRYSMLKNYKRKLKIFAKIRKKKITTFRHFFHKAMKKNFFSNEHATIKLRRIFKQIRVKQIKLKTKQYYLKQIRIKNFLVIKRKNRAFPFIIKTSRSKSGIPFPRKKVYFMFSVFKRHCQNHFFTSSLFAALMRIHTYLYPLVTTSMVCYNNLLRSRYFGNATIFLCRLNKLQLKSKFKHFFSQRRKRYYHKFKRPLLEARYSPFPKYKKLRKCVHQTLKKKGFLYKFFYFFKPSYTKKLLIAFGSEFINDLRSGFSFFEVHRLAFADFSLILASNIVTLYNHHLIENYAVSF